MTEKYKMLGHCVSPVIVYLLSTYTILYHGIPKTLEIANTLEKTIYFPKKVELLEISYFQDWAKYINIP